MKKVLIISALIFIISAVFIVSIINISAAPIKQMENLDRGVVAVKVSNGVFISWRLLGTEESSTEFNIYRDGTKITSTPIKNSTNYTDTSGSNNSKYTVAAVVNGSEKSQSKSANVWGNNYLPIKIQKPSSSYAANDCSVGDLNGDGQYEIILKWEPLNAKDNSQSGVTDNVLIDAYTLEGTRLWRIDLGRNIRAGAHYTQFMVYDFDGNGKAEMACKTADGTKDGKGTVIGNANADYRNSSGYILSGPEFLTVFNGETGAAITTIDYEPARGTVSSWGDNYGNRVDRFLACVAYLDGTHPSLVMCRGYYTRAVLVAYDFNGSKLTKRWTFDSNTSGNSSYAGQGNHNLSVGDADGDGKDEIIYGSCTIDDNGKGLYSTGLGHGDALHFSDFDPDRNGLEVWQCHESGSGATFRDAKTGSIIFRLQDSGDVGRACAADVIASSKGAEVWASGSTAFSTCKGANAGTKPSQINFAIWWDGDLLRELLDKTTISKYNGSALLSASNCTSINGTKANPCLSADLIGDWREEVIFPNTDSTELRLFTTTTSTSHKLYTLMHDSQYRTAIAWQNVAYNQPPHPGFYLGEGMSTPPKPNISVPGGTIVVPSTNNTTSNTTTVAPSTPPVSSATKTVSPSVTTTTQLPSNNKATVNYVIQNDWGSGATVNVTITNSSSSAISNWSVTWTFGGNQKITNIWNAEYTQSGTSVTVKASSWNNSIAANSSISFGFNLSYSGSNGVPTNITIN